MQPARENATIPPRTLTDVKRVRNFLNCDTIFVTLDAKALSDPPISQKDHNHETEAITMTTRMPWGSYRATAHIDTKPPYFLWNTIPWLGFALFKLGPFKFQFNWPVTFEINDTE